MWKEYKETFDGVHASQRLRTEVLDMKREENVRSKRRIPAAALVAAVLVIALAGTALAYLSRVTVAPYEDGYSVQAEVGNIPLSSLPEEVLRRAASATDSADILPFQSWDEAEAYLGLELGDNARLDQMEKNVYRMSLGENGKSETAPCLIWLDHCENLPSCIRLVAAYKEGNLQVLEETVLLVENPALGEDRPYWYGKPSSEMVSTESYVTPSGIEATIVTSQGAGTAYMKYEANFVLNQSFFRVKIEEAGEESRADALTLLKEILDAYE